MGDPYRAKRRLRNGVREDIPTLPVARLSSLGASPRVLQEATNRWAGLPDEERIAVLEEMAQLDDAALQVRIGEMEEELGTVLQGTVSPPTASISVPKGNIAQITSWVGDDPLKAQAALEFETSRPRPRPKLRDALAHLVKD